MKQWIGMIPFFLLALMAAVVFSARQPLSLQAIYVFGDSLSDTGSVFQASGGLYPPNPPYYQGRYSNGPIWVEYLAHQRSIDRITNLAWGGATTGDRSDTVPGLLSQVQSFVQSRSQVEANALYVLWAGANDYLQGTHDVSRPVANISAAIATLTHNGATHFLIANLPDLGQLPATRNTAASISLTTLTQAHNQGLQRSLQQWQRQHPQVKLAVLDANTLYQQAIAQPSTVGFTNVTQPCLTDGIPCANPDQFLFWDSIHPTTQAHRILADAAASAMAALDRPQTLQGRHSNPEAGYPGIDSPSP